MRVLCLLLLIHSVLSNECYSCTGDCHSERCNCQMGSCPSKQCFMERRPTERPGVYKLTKGCLRRPSRKVAGCDYDHFSDHVLCVCEGEFCNDQMYLRPHARKNITCRKCPERNPECGETCQGQWCHEDSSTGAAGCGYGPPALPFYYKGIDVLRYPNPSKICVTMSRGLAMPRKHCICSTDWCNQYYRMHNRVDGVVRSRSLLTTSSVDPSLPLFSCVNCELTATHDQAGVTASCKNNRCMGHFCTYTVQRHIKGAQHTSSERQGCMNVSDSQHIQLGCSDKWIKGEYEETLCACRGDGCNRDIATATASSLLLLLPLLLPLLPREL